jgi:3-oxoacyl-[acyl-carrier-protein] synthase II
MEPIVTGIGLLTVLGESSDQTWSSLLSGRCIADHSRIPGFSGPDRAIAMAQRAAAEGISHAGWTRDDCVSPDTGIYVGTSKGAIESWISGSNSIPSPALAQIDAEIAREFKFGPGPRLTISSACSSGLHALLRATMAIESAEIRRALIVGVEASVHPLFISSFRRLGVLAPEGHGCRPFDQQRRGFVISEAAATLCLESSENPVGRPMVRIDRWAVGGDGTHLTAGDPSGNALRNVLKRVIGPGCDLVHAHATGTVVNDPVELAAIASAGSSQPWLYSHKGALGHSLGAAGLVAVAINCLSHQHGIIPPNIRTTQPLPTDGPRLSAETVQMAVRRSVAIAAGFGGPLAVVSFVSS